MGVKEKTPVVIVDDDRILRMVLARYLQVHAAESFKLVNQFASAEEAHKTLSSSKWNRDRISHMIVVTDYTMDEINGITLIRFLAKLSTGVRFVLYTGGDPLGHYSHDPLTPIRNEIPPELLHRTRLIEKTGAGSYPIVLKALHELRSAR